MTKKHYELIASTINKRTDLAHGMTILKDSLVSDLCIIFKGANERFDADLFKSACYGGVKDEI